MCPLEGICPIRTVLVQFAVLFLGFSLGSWLSTKGYTEPLTGDQANSLMRDLGMEKFVSLTCDRNSSFYQPETIPGWKIEPGTNFK